MNKLLPTNLIARRIDEIPRKDIETFCTRMKEYLEYRRGPDYFEENDWNHYIYEFACNLAFGEGYSSDLQQLAEMRENMGEAVTVDERVKELEEQIKKFKGEES